MNPSEQRLSAALAACRTSRIRLTRVRQAVLAILAAQRLPVSLETIGTQTAASGRFDSSTVYRTLMLFNAAGIVRLVGTSGKASHFILAAPGESHHFLICRRCGCIRELPLPEPLAESLRRTTLALGFAGASQDHEIHGLCTACEAASRQEAPSSKIHPIGGIRASASIHSHAPPTD